MKNIKYAAIIASVTMTAATSQAASILNLTLDSANSDGGAFNLVAADTLTDDFAYNPDTPTLPLPNAQGSFSEANGGFHGNKSAGLHVLSFTLSDGELTTTDATATIYFDFYGRNGNLNRDNNYTVTLFNGDYVTSVSQQAGQGVADTAPFHNRTTFNLGAGIKFDRIQVTAPTGSNDSPEQYFTVMEVRAATVPEPSAALLGGLGLLGLLRRRR